MEGGIGWDSVARGNEGLKTFVLPMDLMEFSPVAVENEFVHGHFICGVIVRHPLKDTSHVGHDAFAMDSLFIKHGSTGVLFIGFHGIKPLFILSLDVKVQDSGVPWLFALRCSQNDVRKFVEFAIGRGRMSRRGRPLTIDRGMMKPSLVRILCLPPTLTDL